MAPGFVLYCIGSKFTSFTHTYSCSWKVKGARQFSEQCAFQRNIGLTLQKNTILKVQAATSQPGFWHSLETPSFIKSSPILDLKCCLTCLPLFHIWSLPAFIYWPGRGFTMEVKPAKAKQSTTIDNVFFTITAVYRLSVNERVHSLPILSTPLFFTKGVLTCTALEISPLPCRTSSLKT